MSVALMTFSQAAAISQTEPEEIIRLAEKGEIHRIHNSKGEVMLCGGSLNKSKLYS